MPTGPPQDVAGQEAERRDNRAPTQAAEIQASENGVTNCRLRHVGAAVSHALFMSSIGSFASLVVTTRTS